MRYTVVWKPSAEQELASLWLKASERIAITDAVNSIDSLLRLDPQSVGESRTRTVRVVIAAPVVITFEIFEEDRVVRVLSIHHSKIA